MKNSIYLFAIITLLFVACKNEKKQTHSNHEHSEEMKMNEMNSDDKHISNGIIDSYIELKNALVKDDEKNAALAGNNLASSFRNFEMSKLNEMEHKQFMEIMEASIEHAEHIAKSDIGHQREHFESLSSDIADLITIIGTDKTLYLDYCPMYNNNQGGMWISETEEISNPYFGAKMMKCGKITKQIN